MRPRAGSCAEISRSREGWTRVCGDSTGSRVRRVPLLSLPRAAGKAALTEKLQADEGGARQSYCALPKVPAKERLALSFFDDDEETAARPSSRAPRRPVGDRPAGASPRQPQPRPPRPQHGGAAGIDQHTLMGRRRGALGRAIVVLILIV